jgi:hypothetical protein
MGQSPRFNIELTVSLRAGSAAEEPMSGHVTARFLSRVLNVPSRVIDTEVALVPKGKRDQSQPVWTADNVVVRACGTILYVTVGGDRLLMGQQAIQSRCGQAARCVSSLVPTVVVNPNLDEHRFTQVPVGDYDVALFADLAEPRAPGWEPLTGHVKAIFTPRATAQAKDPIDTDIWLVSVEKRDQPQPMWHGERVVVRQMGTRLIVALDGSDWVPMPMDTIR